MIGVQRRRCQAGARLIINGRMTGKSVAIGRFTSRSTTRALTVGGLIKAMA
jgi:hypothetical protein